MEANSADEGTVYDVVRKAGPYPTLFHLYSSLGIQSNVVVSAQYTHDSALLMPSTLFRALRIVIDEHPVLGYIGVSRPSDKREGNHRLWEARLREIDLSKCVEYVDAEELSVVLEKAHNEWCFHSDDTTKPWWRLIVVDKTRVVFNYHHSMCDGLSGYAFHRSLLAALNNTTSHRFQEGHIAQVPIADFPPTPFDHGMLDDKASILHSILDFLWMFSIRLFFTSFLLFSKEPGIVLEDFPSVQSPRAIEERPITTINILRISNSNLKKSLAACRSNRTSFSALLDTLIKITLAVDIYPQAKIGFSVQPVSLRPLLKEPIGADVLTNAVSAYSSCVWLDNYRSADYDKSACQTSTALWKLAAYFKSCLSTFVSSRVAVREFMGVTMVGEDDEDLQGLFYGLKMYQNNTFMVSNLGVFRSKGTADVGWSITDVSFSGGARCPSVGEAGIVFDVASVEGGDCVICAIHPKGLFKQEDLVKRVLNGVDRRLLDLIKSDEAP